MNRSTPICIALPARPGPFRPSCLIHDGGFDVGDKCDADVAAAAVQLAKDGYAVIAANYPLATPSQATFPNPVYDVFKGIATLRADAGPLKIDSTHIALWGAGAGANIALLAGLDAPFVAPASACKQSCRTQATPMRSKRWANTN